MDIMKRDDKRRPQVAGLCLKALAGEGVVSDQQLNIVLGFYSRSHVFWRRVHRQSRTLRRSGAKVETDL